MSLTSGRLIARNTVFNLIGQGAPLLIALFAIPLLIKGLGTDRFGVLTLAWVVVGYFSIFDFGLGRALTKLVSEKMATGRKSEVPALVWTTLGLMVVFGLIGSLIILVFSELLVKQALKVPAALQAETVRSFYLLALSIPVVISTAGFRGVLEALQRFDLSNSIRIIMGFLTYLGPLAVLPFSRSLFPVVTALVAGRVVAMAAHAVLCFRVMPSLAGAIRLDKQFVRPLLHFGTWMSVTNTLGPVMVYLDRFLIGALLYVAAVAYYTTPYEMITRLWIIPGALVGVLLPAFSSGFARDEAAARLLFIRAVKYIFIAMFPIAIAVVAFSRQLLDLWLGHEFAVQSTNVLQWLAAGVFINSMAQVSFVLMQGVGRPDLSAKLMLVQIPFYILAIWWAINSHGIDGAAFVWTARVIVDAALFFILSKKILSIPSEHFRNMALIIAGALVTLFLISIESSLMLKTVIVIIVLLIFSVISWTLFLDPREQMMVRDKWKSIFFSGMG